MTMKYYCNSMLLIFLFENERRFCRERTPKLKLSTKKENIFMRNKFEDSVEIKSGIGNGVPTGAHFLTEEFMPPLMPPIIRDGDSICKWGRGGSLSPTSPC